LFVFVVDYVTRVTYDSGTIQNCAWTIMPMGDDGVGRHRGGKPAPLTGDAQMTNFS
jgi:hypothetical protein